MFRHTHQRPIAFPFPYLRGTNGFASLSVVSRFPPLSPEFVGGLCSPVDTTFTTFCPWLERKPSWEILPFYSRVSAFWPGAPCRGMHPVRTTPPTRPSAMGRIPPVAVPFRTCGLRLSAALFRTRIWSTRPSRTSPRPSPTRISTACSKTPSQTRSTPPSSGTGLAPGRRTTSVPSSSPAISMPCSSAIAPTNYCPTLRYSKRPKGTISSTTCFVA